MLMMRDLQDAEARYNQAAAELRKYERDSSQWDSAYESLTRDGRRELNLTDAHFQHLDRLRDRLERATRNLLGVRRAWLAGE